MTSLFGLIPLPRPLQARARVQDLKARLDWGEPALTIIDVRDRLQFNTRHILGAISIPMDELLCRVQINLERNRDIYIYGETDDETAIAAAQLRAAGYLNVAELRGGLSAWKAMDYPVEAIAALAMGI
jgi:rhodanese-related sulfurtransferase